MVENSSSSTRAAGEGCSSSSDCGAGLSCLSLAVTPLGGVCSSPGMACSKSCNNTDADCASLGPKFKCFAGCDASFYCGATQ